MKAFVVFYLGCLGMAALVFALFPGTDTYIYPTTHETVVQEIAVPVAQPVTVEVIGHVSAQAEATASGLSEVRGDIAELHGRIELVESQAREDGTKLAEQSKLLRAYADEKTAALGRRIDQQRGTNIVLAALVWIGVGGVAGLWLVWWWRERRRCRVAKPSKRD